MASTSLAGISLTASASADGHGSDQAFRQVNLVSDLSTLGPDVLFDPAVKNPWGIAMGPTTPLWVDNQFNPASNCGTPDCVPAAADLLTKVTLYATNGDPGGAVSVFTPGGRFIKRLVSGAPLNGPWGLAIAPKHWGDFGGALLVGNVDSGMINAFNPRTGRLLGTLSDAGGQPLVNPGLWGLAFGNGTIGTRQTLLFAAGIGEAAGGFGEHIYEHGLVGLIEQVDNDND
jgi:hypothetical protein